MWGRKAGAGLSAKASQVRFLLLLRPLFLGVSAGRILIPRELRWGDLCCQPVHVLARVNAGVIGLPGLPEGLREGCGGYRCRFKERHALRPEPAPMEKLCTRVAMRAGGQSFLCS